MAFDEAHPLKNNPHRSDGNPFIEKRRKKLVDNTNLLSLQNELTHDLIINGPKYIKLALNEAGISAKDPDTPTFFIPSHNISKLADHYQDNFDGLGGGYLPVLDWILIFLHDELLFDIHSYFHETIHALGKVSLLTSEDEVIATRVGYSFSLHGPDGLIKLRRGDFLEEATTNWLAARATVLYARDRGIALPDEKPEKYIAELAGGRPYTHQRDCLLYLSQDDDELLNLFLQARFDLNTMTKLTIWLSKLYGKGTMSKLNKLESREPFENDAVVMKIRPA